MLLGKFYGGAILEFYTTHAWVIDFAKVNSQINIYTTNKNVAIKNTQ